MLNARHISRFVFLVLLMGLIIIAVINCTALRSQPKATRPVSLPFYLTGQTFVYSNGSWEKVTSIDEYGVSWINHRGRISSGSPDFTFRHSSWKTKSRSGHREFSRRKDVSFSSPESLWPLAVGNKTSYLETGRWRDKNNNLHTYRVNWVCRVNGTEPVSVMAGKFDTWKITCQRFTAPRGSRRPRLLETRTWNYSPDVGHYVLTTSRYPDGRSLQQKELLAVLPAAQKYGADVKHRLESSFQTALELNERNEAVSWKISGTDISGATTAGAIFQIPDGTYCRQYRQRLVLQGDQRTYYGMACRESSGNWKIPNPQ